MSRVAWWDCSAGASGDMCLGALVDAGVGLDRLQAAVAAVVPGVELAAEPVTRGGLAATQVVVSAADDGARRGWVEIRSLIEPADLPEPVRAVALDTFGRLARVEAAVHGVTPAEVHFHEVGGHDAIADVVGTAAGLLELHVDLVTSSAVALGSGLAASGHGALPVPAPAVLALLTEVRAEVRSGIGDDELCTPTAAALLAATVQRWGGLPEMRLATVGCGAGTRNPAQRANLLRLVVGDTDGSPIEATSELLLEANVDDLDPRVWPGVLARLLADGASDAWLSGILMKKGRPAHTLHVLVAPAYAEQARRTVFTETSTIGLRETAVSKRALTRTELAVQVSGRPVRVKLARLAGRVVNATPEFDDVAAAALALQRPVKSVLAAALAAASRATLAGSPDEEN